MKTSSVELSFALAAILIITAVYGGVALVWRAVPAASGFYGHLLVVIGFVLMLMTETLYSLRKRSRRARWGRMANWLKFHIFTGIVGPYLVLLHTAWRFNGLAGATLLLTLLIVASGFIGRYIYTAVPRTVEGAVVEASQIQAQLAALQAQMQEWLGRHPQAAQAVAPGLLSPAVHPTGDGRVFNRLFHQVRQRRQWKQIKRKIDPAYRPQIDQLAQLDLRLLELKRQVASLESARRLLSLWHAVHIPIGMALFTAAFIHAAAALYYATLLR